MANEYGPHSKFAIIKKFANAKVNQLNNLVFHMPILTYKTNELAVCLPLDVLTKG